MMILTTLADAQHVVDRERVTLSSSQLYSSIGLMTVTCMAGINTFAMHFQMGKSSPRSVNFHVAHQRDGPMVWDPSSSRSSLALYSEATQGAVGNAVSPCVQQLPFDIHQVHRELE